MIEPTRAQIDRGCLAACVGRQDWDLCNENFRTEIRTHVIRILRAALNEPETIVGAAVAGPGRSRGAAQVNETGDTMEQIQARQRALASPPTGQTDVEALRVKLASIAATLTGLLAIPGWKPSRAHIESARNLLLECAASPSPSERAAPVAGQEAVAWEVYDEASGWWLRIDDRAKAERAAKERGVLIHPIFAAPPASAVAQIVAWQDMASAPKDGTHILARGVRGEASPPTTVHWFGPADLPGLRAGHWYISVQQDEGPPVHPTGWMPLPDQSGEWQGTPVPSPAASK